MWRTETLSDDICFCSMFSVIIHFPPWSAVWLVLYHSAESEQRASPCALQHSPCYCNQQWHHQYWCHSMASTIFERWCSMLWIMSYFFTFPCIFLSIILLQVNLSSVQRIFLELCSLLLVFSVKVQSGLPFLEYNQGFVPCCKPSLFAFMKASLPSILGHLKSVVEVVRCCQGLFLIPSVVFCSLFLW